MICAHCQRAECRGTCVGAREFLRAHETLPTKTFERKCRWCDRLFNHWKTHSEHEKKCPMREAQKETKRRSMEWQRPGFHGKPMSFDETFKGFREGE